MSTSTMTPARSCVLNCLDQGEGKMALGLSQLVGKVSMWCAWRQTWKPPEATARCTLPNLDASTLGARHTKPVVNQ